MRTRLHVTIRETAGKANFHHTSPVLPPPLACLSRDRPASPSLPLIAAVKWVNLARTAQSRHRSCLGVKVIGTSETRRRFVFTISVLPSRNPLPPPRSISSDTHKSANFFLAFSISQSLRFICSVELFSVACKTIQLDPRGNALVAFPLKIAISCLLLLLVN